MFIHFINRLVLMGGENYFYRGMEEETPNSLDKYFVAFFYFFLIYAFFKYRFHYFTLKNVPVLSPTIPFGNLKKALRPKKARYEYFSDLYARIKIRGHKHAGIYLFFKPIYVPVDLDYVKNVLSDDFDRFSERWIGSDRSNLLNFQGQKWKELRVGLIPIFNSNNTKKFLANTERVSENALEFLKEIGDNKNKSVSLQTICKCFTLDLIANLFYGTDLNSFVEKNTPFENHMEKIFKNSIYNSKYSVVSMLFPHLHRRLSKGDFPKKSLKYFAETARTIVEFRDINSVKKNDILQSLLDEKEENSNLEQVVNRLILFTIFTNETISNTMIFALYELSKNQMIQDRLREEIRENDGEYNLGKMTYLHQIIQETLRLYPVIPTILRKCTKDYNLPGSKETLDKGTGLLISILGIHRDPELYENPNVFDPSRFNEENNRKRHPCAYLPYGEGPRTCPAIQFSTMILKMSILTLIRKFRFTPNEKTKNQSLSLNKNSVLMQPKNNLFVNVEPI